MPEFCKFFLNSCTGYTPIASGNGLQKLWHKPERTDWPPLRAFLWRENVSLFMFSHFGSIKNLPEQKAPEGKRTVFAAVWKQIPYG